MPAVRQTEDQRRLDELGGRVSAVEAQVTAIGTQQQVMGQIITSHAEKSDSFRDDVRQATARQEQAIARIEEGLSSTQALSRQLIDDARAEREAKRLAAEAEAAHRRELELRALAAQDARGSRAMETVRAVATHPAVVAVVMAIAGAITAWGASTFGGTGAYVVPAPAHQAPAGQAAATGVMSAGVGGVAE